jgi:hypothetical protein
LHVGLVGFVTGLYFAPLHIKPSSTSTKGPADKEGLNFANFAAFLFKISVFEPFVIFCEIFCSVVSLFEISGI